MSTLGDIETAIKKQVIKSDLIKGGLITGILILFGVRPTTALIIGGGAVALELVADELSL